jgi:hypothetical protein
MANLYYCSNGERISEATIKARYSRALQAKHAGTSVFVCAACGQRRAEHNDHTIAKARCKVIHKTELIYDPDNFEDSCSICHSQWENFKSGDWINHNNMEKRLRFLKEHDPEGYRIRIELTQLILQQQDGFHNENEASVD